MGLFVGDQACPRAYLHFCFPFCMPACMPVLDVLCVFPAYLLLEQRVVSCHRATSTAQSYLRYLRHD